jgi:hypothetical protein
MAGTLAADSFGFSVNTITTFASSFTGSYQPLITKHTYASSCVNYWVQSYYTSPESSTITSGGNDYYSSCQPGGSRVHSPGVCPDAHTIAEVTEYRTLPVANDDSHRSWVAYCCSRYVRTMHTASMIPTSFALLKFYEQQLWLL